MPSTRRRFLRLSALALAGSTGSAAGAARKQESSTSAADWPMARYDPPGTGYHPEASGPKDDVTVAWAHDATDWFLGAAAPICLGETIYAVGNGLLALDTETGERQFGVRGPYRSSPARAPASIYNTATLAVTAPSGISGLNADGGLTVPLLNRTVGNERWAGPRSPGAGFFGPSEAPTPVAADGRIYSPVPETNSLVALTPNDGRVVWRRTHHRDESLSGTFNRPAVSDGTVFATAWPGRVTAFRADTGERQWHRDVEEQTVLPPVATPEGVVVPNRTSVQLRDRADGSVLWNRDLDGNAVESTPAVADGTIFVTDERTSLHALDLATGETQWTAPFEGHSAPVVADGCVYVVDSQVSLVAFDAATGAKRFEYRPSEVPLSPPIVGDGRLYAVNRKRVIALEES